MKKKRDHVYPISLMTIAGLCLWQKVDENELQEQRMLAYFPG